MSLHPDNEILEQLSALIDGELDAERTRFLLRRLAADADLRLAWERMHTARACFPGSESMLTGPGFAAGVAALVAAEPTPRRRSVTVAHFGRWVGGAAVAASVALLALVAVMPGQNPESNATATASVPVGSPSGVPEVAASTLRERDLRPSFAAQTASIARRAGPAGTLGPVASAQPLYVPGYLAGQTSRSPLWALRQDSQSGAWIMVEARPEASEDGSPER